MKQTNRLSFLSQPLPQISFPIFFVSVRTLPPTIENPPQKSQFFNPCVQWVRPSKYSLQELHKYSLSLPFHYLSLLLLQTVTGASSQTLSTSRLAPVFSAFPYVGYRDHPNMKILCLSPVKFFKTLLLRIDLSCLVQMIVLFGVLPLSILSASSLGTVPVVPVLQAWELKMSIVFQNFQPKL